MVRGKKLLTDKGIMDLIGTDRMSIVPFNHDRLGPVSYDIETEVDSVGDYGIHRLISVEEYRLPRDVAGIIGARSRIANKRLFTSFIPLIDPGFKGHLIFLVLDPFHKVRNIQKEMTGLFQVMFFRLGEVDKAYNERKSSTAMDRKGFNEE